MAFIRIPLQKLVLLLASSIGYAEIEGTSTSSDILPDYLLDPNAVLGDDTAEWRYGRAPDYSNTRAVYQETKTQTHPAGSLPLLVENLVKNWEIEASFKLSVSSWRTIDLPSYTFAINGGPPQSAQHMLEVGTYNAVIAPNDFYSPKNSDFASSHKTFKRMMPTFAWEVVEVYSGPPVVAFKWRHWGVMKNDYVGFNDKGEKVTVAANGSTIDIEGITVAHVNEKIQLQRVETWFDPLEMFRQIAPDGVVKRTVVNSGLPKDMSTGLHGGDCDTVASENVGMKEEFDENVTASGSATETRKAVAAPPDSEETRATHEEMSRITAAECPFLMNKE